jgi:hypothetical protein
MEMGAGVGEEEKLENYLGGLPHEIYIGPRSPAVSLVGPGLGPDGPAGRRAIPARHRTGIQNTSSAGPPKWAGRPPSGPKPGPILLDWPPKHLKVLAKLQEGM